MSLPSSSSPRWSIDAGFGLTWIVLPGAAAHLDEIEMSGRKVSLIVRYGVDENGCLSLSRRVVWPTLRTIPNNTHASLIHLYSLEDCSPQVLVDGHPLGAEKPYAFHLDGVLRICSRTEVGLAVTRTIFPSPTQRAALEKITLRNESDHPLKVTIAPLLRQDFSRGTKGVYLLEARHDAPERVELAPGAQCTFGLSIDGRVSGEPSPVLSASDEEAARRAFVEHVTHNLRFECPDPALSRMFDFAKLRTSESIFETLGGLMHGPGGGTYYAATWCNDQCEYANPFFPFLGDETANASALNCYRQYMPFMSATGQAIPSSIVAEGLDIWEGAGDRGDAAMYAYGASRYALALGDPQVARELLPAVDWCLNYCESRKTADGVIASDSDELEGRFSHGATNLATSSLAYGGLRSAAHLARACGQPEKAADYDRRAGALAGAIDRVFAARLNGYETYRYHEGLELLRSWVCLPLVVGLHTRREGTIAALFSPQLWTEDGLRTQEGDQTFWDRSTLYGLRGVFAAGETEKGLAYFSAYSQRRLLGEHAPYPVEAYPEGGQRQLAAESALYCRIVTEGLFGIDPTGLDSFDCTPRLPQDWDRMALRDVRAFGNCFSLTVQRERGQLSLRVESEKGQRFSAAFQPGATLHIHLS